MIFLVCYMASGQQQYCQPLNTGGQRDELPVASQGDRRNVWQTRQVSCGLVNPVRVQTQLFRSEPEHIESQQGNYCC